MLTKPQPSEAVTHEAEAKTHEAKFTRQSFEKP